MTSLEIVNEFIKNIEDTMKEIKSGPWHDLRLLDLNKFKKIKQDLEVLELVKKKNIELGYIALCLKKGINYESALYQYNCSHYRISLNFDEITILAKWLESNKVGDNS